MIESFHVPTDQIAKLAGLLAATFSLSQCLTGIAWGRASDRFGRKPVIIMGLTCTMIGSILFGFSRSLAWAFTARCIQGLSNGNVGIIRTAVAELVPQRELQPRAFSVMPLVWNIGSIFGPALGGALVYPTDKIPWLVGKSKLFEEYPFAFPNLVCSILFLVGISTGVLFLRETLEEKRHKKDYGLALGRLLTRCCSKKRTHKPRTQLSIDQSQPFLADTSDDIEDPRPGQSPTSPTLKPKQSGSQWREVFSYQSNLNLLVYTLLAMHSVAFDQLLPIFMHHPTQTINDPGVHLPFKFAGGFGIDSSRIGVLFMMYGIYGMTIQFAFFPPIARRFGVLNCLKGCALTFPLVYIATPFTSLLPTNAWRQGAMMVLMLFKGWCAIFAFPCSTILLTNSATSLKILGTLNGVATSISAIGRAAGPALAGAAFTGGVDIGYVIISWWFLASVAIIGAIPIFWLEEMEGFGSNESSTETSDTEDDQALELTGEDEITSADQPLIRKVPPHGAVESLVAEPDQLLDEEAVLTETTSRSSQKQSQHRESFSLRRIPSPIGMGPGVHPAGARRYSSDLGASRSGFGAGGTSYH